MMSYSPDTRPAMRAETSGTTLNVIDLAVGLPPK
jgi:hypothetical protein